MPDYAIEVRYGNGLPTLRIPLSGVSANEAELDREHIAHEIEHARDLNAPCMIDELRSGTLTEHVEIPVDGAIEVDLVEA